MSALTRRALRASCSSICNVPPRGEDAPDSACRRVAEPSTFAPCFLGASDGLSSHGAAVSRPSPPPVFQVSPLRLAAGSPPPPCSHPSDISRGLDEAVTPRSSCVPSPAWRQCFLNDRPGSFVLDTFVMLENVFTEPCSKGYLQRKRSGKCSQAVFDLSSHLTYSVAGTEFRS